MGRSKRQTDGKSYLSAPKTSAETSIKGRNYIVESYYIGRKNIHDTLISIAESEAYEEMRRNKKTTGSTGHEQLELFGEMW
ncbi:MAG: hypothetical protein SO373_02735 [Candidatus Borkfalkiaceae bacterium]|nr:hypothetical protein [Christensenellaceae bacterium]